MNIPNKLKNKIINREEITSEEAELFIKYIIDKSITITNHMYNNKHYLPIYLLFEICYSYNIDPKPYNKGKTYYAILNLDNKKYIIDLDFNDNKIKYLKDNKYIEYTEDIYQTYLNI